MMKLGWLLLCVALLAPLSAVQADKKSDLYNQALAAIEAHDWEALAAAQQRLGSAYPLNAYLEYAQLMQQLDDTTAGQITTFTKDYRDTPLAGRLLSAAMDHYADAERWQEVLALTDKLPSSLSLRCDYVQAKLETGAKVDSYVADLLQRKGALPHDCRRLFSALAEADKLAGDDLLLLMHQAFRHGQSGWLNKLAAWLPDSNQEKQWLLKLYQSPQQLNELPKRLVARQSLYALALARLTRRDVEAALASWQTAPASLFVDDNEKQQLAARIAWYSAISSEKYNRQWLDSWLPAHANRAPSTLQQRARRAVIEQDWASLVQWIGLLPAAEKDDAQWRYWLARAYQQLGKEAQSRQLMQAAAGARTFYGFLAARDVQQPLQLEKAVTDKHAQLHLDVTQMATLARVRLLVAAGHDADARREWHYLLNRVSADNQSALARYALRKHWYHFAIASAIHAGRHDRLDWRFPLAWQGEFSRAAKQAGADDGYLMMAVARRESAFFPAARSRVGAMGLMQLMPATAKHVAQDLGLKLDSGDLFDVSTNMTLGSDYLAGLLQRYQGNRVLALAAYNAGPRRVDAWLRDKAVPADVWIASIPFHETRAYVKAVLAYRAIFMRRAGIADADIDLLGDAARGFAYTSESLAKQQAATQLSSNP